MKQCRVCGVEKDESEFYKNKSYKDGLDVRCKTCERERKLEDKDKVSERMKQRYQDNKDMAIEVNTKRCSKCGVERGANSFHKNWGSKDGLSHMCKECRNAYNQNNRDKIAERGKAYHQANKDKIAERRLANKDKKAAKDKAYYQENKEKIVKNVTAYRKTRRGTDPLFYFMCLVRGRVLKAFNAISTAKTSTTPSLLGATPKEIFDAWGVDAVPAGYHIDHIVPLGQAKSVEEVEKLCHWTNLQLLPAEENLKKSDNRTPEGEALCLTLLGRLWI